MESSVSVMTAAPVVPFLMTAVKAFSAVMTAIVPLTVVVAAFMTFPVVMTVMIALRIGIILERALRKRSGCCVRRTGHAAVELDARLCQCILSAHADAAADQGVHLRGFQETGQRAVPAAVGGHDLLRDDPPVLHVVQLELLRVAEMLKDLSVFIGDCDSHMIRSFL